ncbi:MAG TPA: hypothetical protein VLA58_01390 [Chitinophagaceae bacterium]|nr:hypothetical protein [Chitinophagaceae bacterium]
MKAMTVAKCLLPAAIMIAVVACKKDMTETSCFLGTLTGTSSAK